MGGEVATGALVTRLRRQDGWIAETTAGVHHGTFLANCAGLYSDRVARMAGERPAVRIVPFRGEYYRLAARSASLVRHLIYPVAPPAFPFLGVHLTRRVDGAVDAGPNAVLALSREGYRRNSADMGDLLEMMRFGGLYRFVLAHPALVWRELRQSASRGVFFRAVRRLVPEVREEDLVPGGTGVRAQAMTGDGRLVHDFLMLRRPDALHVLNAPSPAATASLSLARDGMMPPGTAGLDCGRARPGGAPAGTPRASARARPTARAGCSAGSATR
jgi:L-2-hydroxyglutarate oxidase LhgO